MLPPYLTLALLYGLVWLLLALLRKEMRTKMLVMSLAVIPFAFFDYFSQPNYWHPERLFSIPVGIESILFGFFFGGIAAVIYPTKLNRPILPTRRSTVFKNIFALSPVLVVSVGVWWISGINIMITLPIGLLTGCLLILVLRPSLAKNILYSGLYFGLVYPLVLFFWFWLFPQTQEWWNLKIYDNITIMNVPLGEVLFGFLFGGFWGAAYEFVLEYKTKTRAVVDKEAVNLGVEH